MSDYAAPLDDMRFVINELCDLDGIAGFPGYQEATPDLVDLVLEEAGKLATGVIAPLNHDGDVEGCHIDNGVVRTPKGTKEAYAQFVEGGWNGVPFDPDFGGQGLPWLVSTALSEMWNSSNMAFALCPLLTQGAVELLSAHGSDDLKKKFLANMISGHWNGTMNLTEPQAGTDLAQVRSRAERQGDDYKITGQKVFITYGEHDMTDNIVHMVLARVPDAPPGIKGLSLFVVPKFMVNDDGTLGDRNDLHCVSIEHKLGISASPTAVMSFGDDGGATGYLVGEENNGIRYMFTMMNNARLAVGLQGVAIGERAFQQARDFARDRIQSRATGGSDPAPVAIINHPDVKRMLMSMKSRNEAARALAYYTAATLDAAKRHPDQDRRQGAQNMVDLLIPVVKAWSTDNGIDIANIGIQVHGGMGYIEETGAAQHLRDARIATIYEGTNGIQAIDLIGRKVARDQGHTVAILIDDMKTVVDRLKASGNDQLAVIGDRLETALSGLKQATDWIVETYASKPNDALAVA
ncbi:MAG TPA: acyl-CoA dehydrogenase, partial [Rhodospirillales bacterium]|nr:acyl-CoA dehydrogenase [Rhodospirillales bacterium]